MGKCAYLSQSYSTARFSSLKKQGRSCHKNNFYGRVSNVHKDTFARCALDSGSPYSKQEQESPSPLTPALRLVIPSRRRPAEPGTCEPTSTFATVPVPWVFHNLTHLPLTQASPQPSLQFTLSVLFTLSFPTPLFPATRHLHPWQLNVNRLKFHFKS